MNLTKQTTAGFENQFGYLPTGVWSAPGRANLIGEHTDYNNGFVLPFGINKRTYAAMSKRDDSLIRIGTSFTEGIVEFELRDAEQLKYLAGSESAMGAFVGDVAPEETAARLKKVIK